MSEKVKTFNSMWENKRLNFISNINNVEENLKGLWLKIGLDEELIEKRIDRVFAILDEVLGEMVNEEQKLLQQLEEQVKEYTEKLVTLASELHIERIPFESTNNLLQDEDKLRFLITEFEKDKKNIMNEWKNLDNLQKAICNRLGTPPSITPLDGVPTDKQMKSLISLISTTETDLKAREAKFLVIKQEIIKMVDEMEYLVDDAFIKTVMAPNSESTIILSNDNMNKISHAKERLDREFQDLKRKIDRSWATIVSLWAILGTPEKEMLSFKNKNTKYTTSVLSNLTKEESRLKGMRLENLGLYIPRLKQQLYQAWDKIRFGKEKRAQFIRIYENNVSEESLTAHEDALVIAQEYYENNKEIFQVLEKRDENWKLFYEFETSQTKADKFNNRGGALLKEEKLRKTVYRELPKLEDQLFSLVQQWEAKNGVSFLIDDLTLTDYISQEQSKLKNEKDEKKRIRQLSRTPTATPTAAQSRNTTRLNNTLYKPRFMTETCNRTKVIDSTNLYTPVKRRSSLMWPLNTMSVPMKHTNAIPLQPSTPQDCQEPKRCLNNAFKDVLKNKNHHLESPLNTFSQNIAVVSPIFAHTRVINACENGDDNNDEKPSKNKKLASSSLTGSKENNNLCCESFEV